nr:hypothetical protein GCM10020092_029080 [Actinoplanes digitatis]
MHVDEHAGQELEAGTGTHAGARDPRPVTADDHRAGHHRGAGAGAAEDHRALLHEGLQRGVRTGTAEHRGDPQLVAAGEEDAGRGRERLDHRGLVGLCPGLQPQRTDPARAEAGEEGGVLGLEDGGLGAGGGDDDQLGGGTAGQVDEAAQDLGAAGAVPLGAADDQQPGAARSIDERHAAPPPSNPTAYEAKRKKPETSG